MHYLNTAFPTIQFQKARKGKIYVDKSGMLEIISQRLGTMDNYICITRPRRFGKTVNATMLGAYYTIGQDSSALFGGLKISRIEYCQEHQNQYNVIYIDFSRTPDICQTYEEYIGSIIKSMQEDFLEAYPVLSGKEYDSLASMLQDTGDQFLFIFDEWDSIFYKQFMTAKERNAYLEFLKNLLKDRPYVTLAYMTGILPIAKYSSGSALNMFEEYDFINDNIFDQYFGFQEDEVRALCKKFPSVSFGDIKYWYDGYYQSNGSPLFNPRSVSQALMRGKCLNYWTQTGPMNEIADCIEHNAEAVCEDIVKMVANLPVQIKLNGYSAAEPQLTTRNEILSAMVVYGFLSYHEGTLQIPNQELMEKYQAVLERNSMGEVKKIIIKSREMLDATLSCEEGRVAEILEEVHDREIPFLSYNDENSLSCVITLCYLAAREDYHIYREEKSGKGYCDYLFLPRTTRHPAIILELKVNESKESAIQQIKNKNYLQKTEAYPEVILVGINYGKKEKKHTCKIEKIKNVNGNN